MKNICNGCGLCCSLFLINLSRKEYFSGKFQKMFDKIGQFSSFEEAVACGGNLLAQKEDGSCIYLKNNKCGIHNNRPKVCRGFFCTSKLKKFSEMKNHQC